VAKVRAQWPNLGFESVHAEAPQEFQVGATMPITARVRLGELRPDDVWVEAYYGPLGQDRQIEPGTADTVILDNRGEVSPGVYEFSGLLPGRATGTSGYTIRLLPRNAELVTPYELHLIRWASG